MPKQENVIKKKQSKEEKYKKMREWDLKNPDKVKSHRKKHYDNNKQNYKDYYQENREKIIAYNVKLDKKRRKTDINYRLKGDLRVKLNRALNGNHKSGQTLELLGYTIDEFKLYLEKQFKPEMNWDNHGDIWEIDHIKPISKFNLINFNQQKQCFHYTNLQPLFKTTEIAEQLGHIGHIGNRNKSNKV